MLRFECGCIALAEIMNEVVSTLRHYPYTRQQIAECLYDSVRLLQTALREFEKERGMEWEGSLSKIYCPINLYSGQKREEFIYLHFL